MEKGVVLVELRDKQVRKMGSILKLRERSRAVEKWGGLVSGNGDRTCGET